MEVHDWLEGDTDEPPGIGLRYSPPERIQESQEAEDLKSDLYCVGMVAAEIALGRVLLSGTPQDLVDQILGEEASKQLEDLSRPVRGLLGPSLRYDPTERPSNVDDLVELANELLPSLRGLSLESVARGAYGDEAMMLSTGLTLPVLTEEGQGEMFEVLDDDGTDIADQLNDVMAALRKGPPPPPRPKPPEPEPDPDPDTLPGLFLDPESSERPVEADNVMAWDGGGTEPRLKVLLPFEDHESGETDPALPVEPQASDTASDTASVEVPELPVSGDRGRRGPGGAPLACPIGVAGGSRSVVAVVLQDRPRPPARHHG